MGVPYRYRGTGVPAVTSAVYWLLVCAHWADVTTVRADAWSSVAAAVSLTFR